MNNKGIVVFFTIPLFIIFEKCYEFTKLLQWHEKIKNTVTFIDLYN